MLKEKEMNAEMELANDPGIKKWARWTEEEIDTLTKYYPTMGLKVISKIPGRSYVSVRGMISEMKLTRKGHGRNPWTEEELQILKKYYPVSREKTYELIPTHSAGSIRVKASHLGLNGSREENNPSPLAWTLREDEILRQFYPSEGPFVSKRLTRTESACVIRASVLGVAYDQKNNPMRWTEEEDQVIRNCWKEEGTDCFTKLPNRSMAACKTHARNLGVVISHDETWTVEDLALFMYYFPKEKFAVMNRMKGIHTSLNCEKMAKYLGYLPSNSKIEHWSEGENQIISDHYEEEKAETCRMLPKRTRCATVARGRKYLKDSDSLTCMINAWTEEEIAILKKFYPTEGKDVIKRLPGRKTGDIQQKAYYLHLCTDEKKGFYWTKDEKETLLKFFPTEGSKVYKRLPNRSASACARKYKQLTNPEEKKQERMRWTEEEVAILREFYPTEGKKVAERLPRWSPKKCASKALFLGIPKPSKGPTPRDFSEFFEVVDELKNKPIKGICLD